MHFQLCMPIHLLLLPEQNVCLHFDAFTLHNFFSNKGNLGKLDIFVRKNKDESTIVLMDSWVIVFRQDSTLHSMFC